MPYNHHELPALLGVILVVLVRALYHWFPHRRQRLNLPNDVAKTPRDEETESLLPRPTSLIDRPFSIRGKCVIGIAATGYMAIAIYALVKTIIDPQLQHSVLFDNRFQFGRFGTVMLGFLIILRCTIPEPLARSRTSSDAVALIAAPYVIYLIKMPIPNAPEIPWLDLMVAPTLGAICWLGARLS